MADSGHARLHELRKGDALMSTQTVSTVADKPRLARRLDRDRAVRPASAGLLGRRHHRRRRQEQARHHHRTQGSLRGPVPRVPQGAPLEVHLRPLVLRRRLHLDRRRARTSTCPTSCPTGRYSRSGTGRAATGCTSTSASTCRRGPIPVDHCGTLYQVGAKFELRCCGYCEDKDSHLAVAGHEAPGRVQFV